MTQDEYYILQKNYQRRIRETTTDFKRYLFYSIDWRDRLISIVGARGTGKTTMILQRVKEAFSDDPDKALYASLDNLWFETHSLLELVDFHYQNGGTHIFLDEIHYLADWQRIIKNIYDDYPGWHIVYTGAALLKIDHES